MIESGFRTPTVQTGGSLGFESRGTETEEMYDAAGTMTSRRSFPFAQTFLIRRPTGGPWLIVAVLPLGAGP